MSDGQFLANFGLAMLAIVIALVGWLSEDTWGKPRRARRWFFVAAVLIGLTPFLNMLIIAIMG